MSDGITVPDEATVIVVGDPDSTWKVLGLVNDWIKHAETKAVGTLAAAGVSAGVLFNLTKGLHRPGWPVWHAAALCAFLISVAALTAAWALRPRLWSSEEPVSNLYFDHIARNHPKATKGTEYLDTLRGITSDDAVLVAEIAGQVWANAHVARAKYMWANIGLSSILVGYLALGLTALLVAVHNH